MLTIQAATEIIIFLELFYLLFGKKRCFNKSCWSCCHCTGFLIYICGVRHATSGLTSRKKQFASHSAIHPTILGISPIHPPHPAVLTGDACAEHEEWNSLFVYPPEEFSVPRSKLQVGLANGGGQDVLGDASGHHCLVKPPRRRLCALKCERATAAEVGHGKSKPKRLIH